MELGYKIFRELINYGAKFQVISVFQMLYEPITKGLISKFRWFSLSLDIMKWRLDYSESSEGINCQCKPSDGSGSSPYKQYSEGKFKRIIQQNDVYNFFCKRSLNLCFTYFYTNYFHFVDRSLGANICFFNVAFINFHFCKYIRTAYFSCVGEGNLNLILKSQIMIGILNLILGYVLGYYFSGKGVIVSWAISVAISSFYLFYNYQKEKDIPLTNLFTKYNVILFVVSVLVTIFSFVFYDVFASYINNILGVIRLLYNCNNCCFYPFYY